jgi:hypothetical protein
LVDIRNQVGTKRTIHAGGLEISSFTAQQQTLAFLLQAFVGPSPAAKQETKMRNQETVYSRESWQKPL